MPRTNNSANGRDGLSSAGIIAPAPVTEMLLAVPTPGVRDGNRVRCPTRSAAYWSSEVVFRNPVRPGCGAAVRKHSAGWCPPSTSGCETPENAVIRPRSSANRSRYGVGS